MLDWLQHTAMPWVQSKLGLSRWLLEVRQGQGRDQRAYGPDHRYRRGRPQSQATASSLALIGFLTNLVLIPVVAFYLLRDWDIMMAKIRSLLPRAREPSALCPGQGVP
jgi:predicted PurR-regulated permease PerM